MRIVIEGIWGSPADYLVEQVITRQDLKYDKVSVCVPSPPFNGIRGWTYALTENMRLWREHQERESEVTLYQHCVWSSYAFARALVGDSQLEQDEIDLFREMTEGISEVHELPNIIVYCHTFPEAANRMLKLKNSVCAQITIDQLTQTSESMIKWLDEMKGQGVNVIELPPPFGEDLESWYRYAIKTIQKVFNNSALGAEDGTSN